MQTARKKLEYYSPSARIPKKTVKMQGNVAYIDNGYVRKKAAAAKTKQPQKIAKKKMATKAKSAPAAKQVKKRKTGLGSTLFVLFVAFAALAVLVSRYAAVCSIASQNNALEEQIAEIEAEIGTLEIDMELRDDLEYVHKEALELGMEYPDASQKITIDLGG